MFGNGVPGWYVDIHQNVVWDSKANVLADINYYRPMSCLEYTVLLLVEDT